MTGSVLRIGALALVAFATGAGVAPGAGAASPVAPTAAVGQPAPKPAIGDVEKIEDLQALFDADKGKYRIVVLLSPT